MNNGTNKTLLLVEDEVLIAMAEQQELCSYGYEIIHVMTGFDAVSMVRMNNDIDLILMDIDLGAEMDGTEAAGLILKEKKIPIIFVSSHSRDEIIRKTAEVESYGCIVKGGDYSKLNSSIKTAFKLFDSRYNAEKSRVFSIEYNGEEA